MCSDLVYVILFPQMIMVIHFKKFCNTYGSLAAYVIALFFRLAGGEQMLNLEPWLLYPYYDYERKVQTFPFRTFCMILSLATLAIVSKITDYLFNNGILEPKFDVFRCVSNIPEDRIRVSDMIFLIKRRRYCD